MMNEEAKKQVIEKLEEIRHVVPGSYIAQRFFGKSRHWYSQRVNGNLVNGKPAQFSPEEVAVIAAGLRTVAQELEQTADEIERIAETAQ